MWTRDPPMGSFRFLRTVAECQPDGRVKFSEATEMEKIELSLDWQEGEDTIANGSLSDETGFIGRGFTKRGIYVWEIFIRPTFPSIHALLHSGQISGSGICCDATNR